VDAYNAKVSESISMFFNYEFPLTSNRLLLAGGIRVVSSDIYLKKAAGSNQFNVSYGNNMYGLFVQSDLLDLNAYAYGSAFSPSFNKW
jgi:hypothetical protein